MFTLFIFYKVGILLQSQFRVSFYLEMDWEEVLGLNKENESKSFFDSQIID